MAESKIIELNETVNDSEEHSSAAKKRRLLDLELGKSIVSNVTATILINKEVDTSEAKTFWKNVFTKPKTNQSKANAKNKPLKVSVFVGGPPANTFAAVMPLPEGMSELTFAGILGGRKSGSASTPRTSKRSVWN